MQKCKKLLSFYLLIINRFKREKQALKGLTIAVLFHFSLGILIYIFKK